MGVTEFVLRPSHLADVTAQVSTLAEEPGGVLKVMISADGIHGNTPLPDPPFDRADILGPSRPTSAAELQFLPHGCLIDITGVKPGRRPRLIERARRLRLGIGATR